MITRCCRHSVYLTQFTCFTGTKVQKLTQKNAAQETKNWLESLYKVLYDSVYLIYQYKSTNASSDVDNHLRVLTDGPQLVAFVLFVLVKQVNWGQYLYFCTRQASIPICVCSEMDHDSLQVSLRKMGIFFPSSFWAHDSLQVSLRKMGVYIYIERER